MSPDPKDQNDDAQDKGYYFFKKIAPHGFVAQIV